MKELVVKTGNNQLKFLLELFGSGLEVKNVYFAPGHYPIYRTMASPQLWLMIEMASKGDW